MLALGAIAALALLPWLLETFLFRKHLLLLTWWALLPLSLTISLGGTNLNIPSELILLLWISLPLLRGFPKEMMLILKHPVSILLLMEILIYLLATIHSSMPQVSIKRFALHIAYILGAYFLMVPVLLKPRNILKMTTVIGIGLVPVLAVVLVFLSNYNFNAAVAPAGPRPFFSDHTQFGAFAAFVLPMSFIMWYYSKSFDFKIAFWQKLLLPLLLLCVAFSFSRAVWMSTGVIILLFLLIQLKIFFRTLMFLIIAGAAVLFSYSDNIYQTILQNESESDRQELVEQLKSIGNMKTDVSNLERINRWKSAIKMAEDRPWLGFGPGTYQFQYAPFQEVQDKTVISTNFGDAGNAHSEFLMYLSETGIFGFINFILLCLYLVYTGFRLIYNGTEPHLALGLLLGLSGFLVHSLVNSFLETDKIGLLFYFFVAAIVALDIKDRLYKAS